VRAYIESSFHHINDRALVEMTLASISVLLIVLLVSSADIGASPAQQSQQTGDQASIKLGPPMSGADIFKWYCAACHGKNGKGNGPAASELEVAHLT
jgi:cytochrome c553